MKAANTPETRHLAATAHMLNDGLNTPTMLMEARMRLACHKLQMIGEEILTVHNGSNHYDIITRKYHIRYKDGSNVIVTSLDSSMYMYAKMHQEKDR